MEFLMKSKLVNKGLLRIFSRALTQGTNKGRERAIPGSLSYLCVPGDHPLLGLTIGQLVDQASERFGDNEAIYVPYQGIRKTFAQTRKEIDELAEGFLAIGLKKGDCIGIWSPNCYEWYLTHNAVAKAGLVLVSLNPAYQAIEMSFALNRVGVKCLIISTSYKTQNYYDILTTIAPEVIHCDPGRIKSQMVPNLTTVITMEKYPLRGTYTFEEVCFIGSRGTSHLDRVTQAIQFDDLFNIQFTSGSTGQPKGVMLSHHNLVNNSYFCGKRLELTQNDKISVTVPFFHCYGSVVGILAAIHRGCKLVLPAPTFDPLATIQNICKEKCTILYGTPTMHVDMTAILDCVEYDMSSLQVAVTGAASAPLSLCQRMKTKYSIPGILSMYGLTETSSVTLQNFRDDTEEMRNTSAGYPLEHTEVKVIDSHGNIVPVGEVGELCMRGFHTMLGYWDEPDKTKQILKSSKWLHTGDSAILLPNGYVRIVGRLSDMLIRGGENIYPSEIEEFMHGHPKILEAYVFGVPDDRLGEEVAVWVRVKCGEEMTAHELRAYCKGRISYFKIPKYISFRSDFPKTASGKIRKSTMREIHEDEHKGSLQNKIVGN